MKIVKFKEIRKGSLVAFFSLQIPSWGGIIIHDMTLFCSNGKRWIAFPSRLVEKDGERKYYSYLRFETDVPMKKFSEDVLKVLDKYIAENPSQQTSQDVAKVNKSTPSYDSEDLPF